MDGVFERIESKLRDEGINFQRTDNAILVSYREGDTSYLVFIIPYERVTGLAGVSSPPMIPTPATAKRLLEDNLRYNLASYQLNEEGEVVVFSSLRNECIEDSLIPHIYAVLNLLRRMGHED